MNLCVEKRRITETSCFDFRGGCIKIQEHQRWSDQRSKRFTRVLKENGQPRPIPDHLNRNKQIIEIILQPGLGRELLQHNV